MLCLSLGYFFVFSTEKYVCGMLGVTHELSILSRIYFLLLKMCNLLYYVEPKINVQKKKSKIKMIKIKYTTSSKLMLSCK